MKRPTNLKKNPMFCSGCHRLFADYRGAYGFAYEFGCPYCTSIYYVDLSFIPTYNQCLSS